MATNKRIDELFTLRLSDGKLWVGWGFLALAIAAITGAVLWLRWLL